MQVCVLFFASLKDVTGAAEVKLDIPEGTSVSGLVRCLAERWPALQPRVPYLRHAVNESLVAPDQGLQPNDVVALMPPTSGG